MRDVIVRNNEKRVDTSRYGVTLLSHLEEDVDPEVITYKYGKMVRTVHVETRDNPSELTVEWSVNGDGIDDIKSNIEKFKQKLKNCEIVFGCEETKIFYCILMSSKKEFLDMNECVFTTVFSCEKFSNVRTVNILREKQIIEIGGSKETPISFYITAKEAVNDIVINNIKIDSIPKNKTVIIDSQKGLITMDDALYSNRVHFMEFPAGLGDYDVLCNSNKVSIKITYQERW